MTIQNHSGQDAADSPGPLDLAFVTVKGEGYAIIQRKTVRHGELLRSVRDSSRGEAK